MSDPEIVHYQVEDGVALLTMDDGKANALSMAMLEQMDDALAKAKSEAKALVIAGRPGKFCAGFDLKVMMSGPAAAKELVGRGAEMLMRIYEAPMPVVAACTGHAVAGGALILLASDVRIGVLGDFKIGLNEVAIGMTLPILAQELARDRLAPTRLAEAVLHATLYGPVDAVTVGYLDRVEIPDALAGAAQQQAVGMKALPRAAYGATKRRLRRATIEHIRSTLDADLDELTGPAK